MIHGGCFILAKTLIPRGQCLSVQEGEASFSFALGSSWLCDLAIVESDCKQLVDSILKHNSANMTEFGALSSS